MAQLIKVDGKLLVAGLHWLHPHAAVVSEKPQRESFLSRLGKPVGKKSNTGDEATLVKANKAAMAAGSTLNVWGYLTTMDKRTLGKIPRFAKIYSLAEMFSGLPDMPTCAILIAKIPGEEDQFAMCTAINGHPAPGEFDTVVPLAKIETTLLNWEDQLQSAVNKSPVLYGTWARCSQQITIERIAATSVGCRPMRSVGTDTAQAVRVVAILGLAGAAYYSYDEYQKSEAKKRAAQIAIQMAPENVYRKALGEQWAAQQWGSLERVRGLQRQVGRLPQEVEGFRINTSVECDVIQGICAFSYRKIDGRRSTFTQFRDGVRNRFVAKNYGQDGLTVQAELVAKDLPASPAPDVAVLAEESSTPFLFWPTVQEQLPTLVRGAMSSDFKTFPPALGINEAAVPQIVRSVGITISYPLWAEDEMPPAAGVFRSAINWKHMTVSTESEVTLTGELYASKKNM